MNDYLKLRRAMLVSSALLLALAAVAFWPAVRWRPSSRPALKAPIVFDELAVHSPPPRDAAPTIEVNPPSR